MADTVKVTGDTDAKRRKPYPPELIMTSMLLMGNGVPSSKVKDNIIAVFSGTRSCTAETSKPAIRKSHRNDSSPTPADATSSQSADLKTRYFWPDQTSQRRWRFGMAHVCRCHIGMELTKAANDKKQILTGDGTPVNGKHVECFVITTADVKIAMLPWVQASKTSELSAENTVKMINECQIAYNKWYEKCGDKRGLPTPVKKGSLILNVAASVNDHAANETARVSFLSKIRKRVATELGVESVPDMVSFYCNTHKAMLLAKALRKADHEFLVSLFPDRDKGEFRTSNLLDTFQIQISKMFGHHFGAYAFGKYHFAAR